MLKDDRGEVQQVSDERLISLITNVIERMNVRQKEKERIEGIQTGLAEAKTKFCTPEGVCYKDQASLDREMVKRKLREEARKKVEDQRVVSVPALQAMNAEKRQAMSEEERNQRDKKFLNSVELMGGSVVDAYGMVVGNPQDKAAMRSRVINSMTDAELNQAFDKCVGDECKPLRANLIKRGYRIQKKDEKSNRWEPVPVEEMKKQEVHF